MSTVRAIRIGITLLALAGIFALPAPDASAWYCGGAANGNPDDCWRDSDCTGMGVCKNRQCQCGSVEGVPICGDRCEDRGYCQPGACGGNTVHVGDCRGISRGDRGGVISYCDNNPCSPNQGQACQSCNACGMCNNGTIQCNGTCSVGAPSNALCGSPPAGNFDSADCSAARGWSSDPDYAGAVSVHIYRDGPAGSGTYMGAVTANQFYPGRGNVGWSWAIPGSLQDGAPHTLYAYAINVNSGGAPQGANPLLTGSPKNITCNNPPTGTFTSATCSPAVATGTATDAQGSPVTVVIYDGPSGGGGTQIGTGTAAPNFSIPFTPFTNGQTHTLYAYARDIPGGTWYPLTGTQAVACAPAVTLNAAPATVGFAGSTTLSWTVSNGASCTATPGGWFNAGTISGGSGAGSASSGPLTGTTTFTLTCTNAPGQSAAASRTVTVNAPPPTGTITNVSDTDYCVGGAGMVIDWAYESVSRPISAYQVQVLNGGAVVFDTGKVPKTAALPQPPRAEVPADTGSLWGAAADVLRATLLDIFRWFLPTPAQACHGDCGGGSPTCAQACDEGGMASYAWCVDSAPGNGYVTDWGTGKRNNNGNCGGWGNCTLRNCARDFECNAGYDKRGGGGDDGNGPNGWCEPSAPVCNPPPGSSCQSAPNACGMRNNGTIQANCACSASPPSNNLCPPPSCSAAPAQAAVGQIVTATGSGSTGGYSWNSGGGTPATGAGNPRTFTYASAGAKTITVTDSTTGKTNTCGVTICAANWNQPCTTTPNACGMTSSGTIQCDGTCSVTTPPNSACPPPSCSVNPASINAGQATVATGASGIPPYTWASTGGLPAVGSGPSYATTYATTGTKTITITDSNAKAGTCNVNVGASYASSGTVTTSQNQPGAIAYNTPYTIRVMVWDADDRASSWSAPFAYSTKPGPWPAPDFTFTPDKPFAGLPVQFTDTSVNGPTSWLWDFGDGSTDPSQNPAHAFTTEGDYTVTLDATNAAGTCSVTKVISPSKALPQYREVRPGSQPSATPRPTEPVNPTPPPPGGQGR